MKLEIPEAKNSDPAFEWFIPDEHELERHDDPEKIRQLCENMKMNGQLQPVAATETGQLIFGHGRWLAGRMAGFKKLAAKIYPASLSETQVKLIRAAENIHRKELSSYQKYLLCSDLLCGNPTWNYQDLCEYLNLSASMITRLMSPSKVSEDWLQALKDEKVGISDTYAASKLPASEMAGLLALKLSGASRDTIEEVGRRTRTGSKRQATLQKPARTQPRNDKQRVKPQKLSCTLSNGLTVSLSGSSFSLDEAEIALIEAIEKLKRAKELGQTAETFVTQ